MRGGFSSGGAAVATYAADGELDLGALGQALWRRRWRIVLPTIIVALAVFVVVSTLTPRYASNAQVLIDVRENVFLRPDAEKSAPDRQTTTPRPAESSHASDSM